MSQAKVHVIEADLTGNVHEVVENRDRLGRDIAALAKAEGAEIHFHDFKEALAGAPVILLECVDDFLTKVEKLDGFVKAHDVWQDMETERSSSLTAYFTSTPAPAQQKRQHKPRRPGM